MYRIEYLPAALDDLKEIVVYIAETLENPKAALNLSQEIVERVERLAYFPYSAPAYFPIRPLSHEYRRLQVKNYYVFYWVDDSSEQDNEIVNTVTIARIIYVRRNIKMLLV